MKGIHKIFVLLISGLMFFSHTVAYGAVVVHPKTEKMSCCAEKKQEQKSEKTKDSKGCKDENHCEGNCSSHACCMYVGFAKNFFQTNEQKTQLFLFPEESIKNEFYHSSYFKDLSFSFWHPPKYIS